MKKLLLLSTAAIILTATVNAQITPASLKSDIKIDKKVVSNIRKEKKEDRTVLRKLKGSEVDPVSKQSFATDFPGVIAQWERLDNFDEASFVKDGQAMSAFYDWEGKLVGTTQNKTFADLPASAQKSVSNEYKDYAIGDVLFYDDNEANETDMILYGNQFADKDSYFVELTKGNKKIVLQVTTDGEVGYYARLR